MNFYGTRGGRTFIDHTVPSLVKAVEGLTKELSKANEISGRKEQKTDLFQWTLRFAEQSDFDADDICRRQLRAMWTACCLYYNWDCDTKQYDDALMQLWETVIKHRDIEGSTDTFDDYGCFDDYMSEDLL